MHYLFYISVSTKARVNYNLRNDRLFLQRDAMQARHAVLAVCLSVTWVNSVETNKYIFNFFTLG